MHSLHSATAVVDPHIKATAVGCWWRIACYADALLLLQHARRATTLGLKA